MSPNKEPSPAKPLPNPIDLFLSWHNQCHKALREDEADPERVWGLQTEPALGRRIPRLCPDPGHLRYRQIYSLGLQCERLFRLVSPHQLLALAFDGRPTNRPLPVRNGFAPPRFETVSFLVRLNLKPAPMPTLSAAFLSELESVLGMDVQILEKLFGPKFHESAERARSKAKPYAESSLAGGGVPSR